MQTKDKRSKMWNEDEVSNYQFNDFISLMHKPQPLIKFQSKPRFRFTVELKLFYQIN
jgi:hypothetical protein